MGFILKGCGCAQAPIFYEKVLRNFLKQRFVKGFKKLFKQDKAGKKDFKKFYKLLSKQVQKQASK